jgi:uncharacterized protein YjiS (DUF1127 family)
MEEKNQVNMVNDINEEVRQKIRTSDLKQIYRSWKRRRRN